MATGKNCDFRISLKTKSKGLVVVSRVCSGQGDSPGGFKNKNDFSRRSGINIPPADLSGLVGQVEL